jgi:hypothetical protein
MRRGGGRRGGVWVTSAIAALLALAGCASDDGPQNALDAFAEAVNQRDDSAVRQLVCESSRSDGGSSLADPFAGSPYDIDQVDPRLREVHWVAKAGEITDRSDDRATGKVSFTVEGVPSDLSAEAQQVLDSSLAPFPIGLAGEDDTVTLVREGGEWRVCDRAAEAGAGQAAAPATAALQFRAVLVERTPAVTAAPAAAAVTPSPGTEPPGLETLAAGGCANLPATAEPPAEEPLVTCSVTGDRVYQLGPVEVSGAEIVSVSATPAPGGSSGWMVGLKASEAGKARIADLTRRLSANQPPQNQLAVVVDGLVVTAPSVAEPITAGELQITAAFDQAAARALVARITGRST